MKKIETGLIIAIVASVFLVSFLIGRATALRNSDKDKEEAEYSQIILPRGDEKKNIEVSGKTEKVPEITTDEKSSKTEEEKIPERMLFPCGNRVLKDYSQMAVYSETMGDWRAHTGIDFAAEAGDTVICVYDGVVKKVYKDRLWGYTVEIMHTGNIKSVYKNLEKNITVKEGQALKGGHAIGKVGNSADIESLEIPHLHFEIWQGDIPVNPSSYVY